MPRVEVYTKFLCPYCSRALNLLRSKGVEVDEHDISFGGKQTAEMIARAGGRTTVPQIFVGETHVGGCDDLLALDRAGKLDPLLAS